jgi:hypothetical protein
LKISILKISVSKISIIKIHGLKYWIEKQKTIEILLE